MRKSGVRRKHFRAEERARVLREYRASGLTQREFAGRAGVSVSCLGNWLRRERAGTEPDVTPAFVEIPPPRSLPRSGYRLEAPGGAVLEVPRHFSPSEVRELWALLRGL